MLEKLRRVYKGKLVAKWGYLVDGLSAEGYDLVGFTLGHDFITDLNKVRENMRQGYQWMIDAAEDTNEGWMVGEAFLPFEEPWAGREIKQMYKGVNFKDLQDDYFRISFEEIERLPDEDKPRRYAATGYGPGTVMPVTAETQEVTRKFFGRI